MRKNVSRTLSLLLATMLTIGCVAGCSNKEEEKKEASSSTPVSSQSSASSEEKSKETEKAEEPVDYKDVDFSVCWWGNDSRHTPTIALVEEFEKDYKNLSVNVEYTSWGDYWTKLSTQATGGELPDIIQMDYSYIKSYAESGLLLPLDDYIASGALDLSNVAEETVSAGKIDGQMYAIVTGSNAPMMIYDPAMLKDAGVTISQAPTLDEFIEVCKKMYDATGAIHGGLQFDYWTRMMGYPWYFTEEGTEVVFDADTLVSFWEMYAEGVEYGYFPGPDSIIEDAVVSLGNGSIWGYCLYTNSLESNEKNTGKDLAMLALPSTDVNIAPTFMKPNMMWAVTSNCENPELAIEFLNYFVNNSTTYDITGMDRGVPISTEMREHMISKGLTDAQQEVMEFMSFLEDGHVSAIYSPEPSAASEAKAVLTEYTERVQYGTLTKDGFAAAAEEVIKKMNEILAAK